jgi:hypothetical protein
MSEARNPEYDADGFELPEFGTIQVVDPAEVEYAELTRREPATHFDGENRRGCSTTSAGTVARCPVIGSCRWSQRSRPPPSALASRGAERVAS